jgi:hypothetical protein
MYKCLLVGAVSMVLSAVAFASDNSTLNPSSAGVLNSDDGEAALQIQYLKNQGLYDGALWDQYYGRDGGARRHAPSIDVGGETIATCTVISSLPYCDVGNTCNFANDYDEICPYTGSIARDVVYCFTPADTICIDISLCNNNTNYDTKLYVYEGSYTPGNPYACNDDACPNYVSEILGLQLTASAIYYIVIDGYGSDCGDYGLDIQEVECPPPPAPRECTNNTLFGQRPHWSTEPGGNALFSDLRTGYAYSFQRIYDDFSDVNGSICDVHWWGLSAYVNYGWNPCDEDPMTFNIVFYSDSSGVVGSLVCSYDVTVSRQTTTENAYGLPVYYFSSELNPCCELTSGWISVFATSSQSPLDCWFLWRTSPFGDGMCLAESNLGIESWGWDVAFCLTGEPDTCTFPFQEIDMGDLQMCNYPTLMGNPAHALSGVAWLGTGITGEEAPNIPNLDGADDGVVYHNLPWEPCTPQSVTVTVTAGTMYEQFLECGYHLYLNGWKDGNLDGDFCDTLCTAAGACGAPEWIVQDVMVAPGAHDFTFVDPGVTDMGIYDGVFRWRLTSQPVDAYGFGEVDDAACSNMTCGAYAFDFVGEVEDYIIPDGQLPVELTSFQALPGDGMVTLKWTTASETDNDHFVLSRRTASQENFSNIAEIPGNGTSSQSHDYQYVDNSVINGATYQYQLADVDINGTTNWHDTIVTVTPESEKAVPSEYALYQNYPNPFNPITTIGFNIKEPGMVRLTVYDLLGREVATLVNGEIAAGAHSIIWDASNMSSGIYLYRLETGDFTATKKLVLLK